MIESHSLHTYYLALPDYVGFPNAVAMAAKFDLEVKIALEMKEFGNHIMKLLSGRFIHGENPVIGGFGKYPSKEDLLWIKSRSIQFMPFVLKTVKLFCELDYPDSPSAETLYACCEPGGGRYGFWGDGILLSTGEIIPRDEYKTLTNEFIVPHSYAKRSRYNGRSYSVGALARINNLGDRLSGDSARMYKTYFDDRWRTNPLFHNAAQALEILYAFERIPPLIDEILRHPQNPPIVAYRAGSGRGTGIVEAPRGLLIHHYEIEDGLVSGVDLITPTAQNAEDIERYCQIAAQKFLDEDRSENIPDKLNMVVRAFDPCISCSAHMAEVQAAPRDDWKTRLREICAGSQPVFLGLGNPLRSDDALGLRLAATLRLEGRSDVLTGAEFDDREEFLMTQTHRSLVVFDAVDFDGKPGQVILLPLKYTLNNGSLSHRIRPFLNRALHPRLNRNAFLLGIQPQTIEEGETLSTAVEKAAAEVLKELRASLGVDIYSRETD